MADETVDILMITHNRPEYTQLSLARLLSSCDERARVWVWHNGDDQRTLSVLRDFQSHPRMYRLNISAQNVRLREPTNWIYREGGGALVGKVDDDCLVPDGWIESFRSMHSAHTDLGVVACWHFQPEDFDERLAATRIVRLADGSGLMRNPWIGGSGYLMKRECINRHGLIGPTESSTNYWLRLHRARWLLGWRVPLILQDHMDDPRSPHTLIRSDDDFLARIPLSAGSRGTLTLDAWDRQLRESARIVQSAPLGRSFYAPLRRRFRRLYNRLLSRVGVRRLDW